MNRLIHRLLSPERFLRLAFANLVRIGVVTVGEGSYGTPRVYRFRNDPTKLTIGRYSSIGPGVTFVLGGNHPTDRLTVFPVRERFDLPGRGSDGFPSSKGDITVGSDVWIGANATVLSGVSIGHGAVVAAGSLIIRDVEPFTIVGGVPARRLGTRFDDDEVARLLDLAWWDRPAGDVARLAPILCDDGRSLDELVGALIRR